MRAPLLSLSILAAWLLLGDSASPGRLLSGLLLALLLPRLFLPAAPAGAPRHRGDRGGRAWAALRLALVVLVDIVRANLDVARRILGPMSALRPGWVWIPLDLSRPHAVTLFAGIITMTPGTLSVDKSADGRFLLVHALHLPDPEASAKEMKERYEAPLAVIFADPGAVATVPATVEARA